MNIHSRERDITYKSHVENPKGYLQEDKMIDICDFIDDLYRAIADVQTAIENEKAGGLTQLDIDGKQYLVDNADKILKKLDERKSKGELEKKVYEQGIAHIREESDELTKKVKDKFTYLNNTLNTAISNYNNQTYSYTYQEFVPKSQYEANPVYYQNLGAYWTFGGYYYNKTVQVPYPPISVSGNTIDSKKVHLSGWPNHKNPYYSNVVNAKDDMNDFLGKGYYEDSEDFGRYARSLNVNRFTANDNITAVVDQTPGLRESLNLQGDLYYYGEMDGVRLYYDTGDGDSTFNGHGFQKTDAFRLFTIIDGQKCYISNVPTKTNDSTARRGTPGRWNYDISVAQDPIDSSSTVLYFNHQSPDTANSDNSTLYYTDPDGNSHTFNFVSATQADGSEVTPQQVVNSDPTSFEEVAAGIATQAGTNPDLAPRQSTATGTDYAAQLGVEVPPKTGTSEE